MSVEAQKEDFMDLILEKGPEVGVTDDLGNNVFHLIAYHEKDEVFNKVFRYGVSQYYCEEYIGENTYTETSNEKLKRMVTLKNAINDQNDDGNTPLHEAVIIRNDFAK